MTYTPYHDQPDTAFWSRSVARPQLQEVNPVSVPSFSVYPHTRVATAGSCFAQHISRYLGSIGVSPYVTEKSHPLVAEVANDFQYGLYTARYGNIYTSRQLVQLFERAYGRLAPKTNIWIEKNSFSDPFRPGIPGGFATELELKLDREKHFAAVREMFQNLDIFVFTLGLTETWATREDGCVYPSCPGAIAGSFEADKHYFVNLSVKDVANEMAQFISYLRGVNRDAKIILTVSPVPLIATATSAHVLPATIYSKSVLRVAAQQLTSEFDCVEYFPSYEIITGPQTKGAYFSEDLRTVTAEGVRRVMSLFGNAYANGINAAQLSDAAHKATSNIDSDLREGMNLVCEELYNEITKVNSL